MPTKDEKRVKWQQLVMEKEIEGHHHLGGSSHVDNGNNRRAKLAWIGQSQTAFLVSVLLLYCCLTLPSGINVVRSSFSLTSYENMFPSTPRRAEVRFLRGMDQSLQIAWIMSFPNSGTSFTIKNIRHLGMTQTATNYGHENAKISSGEPVPVFGDQPGGPFWMDPDVHPEYKFPEKFVLVKTHCGGRCVTCPPGRYIESTFSFRQQCLTGKSRSVINGTKVDKEVTYTMDRVAKAIHIIRDPFDNVVSRYHMERKSNRSAIGYNNTRDEFRRYCFWLNDEYDKDERNSQVLVQSNLLSILEKVPCRADFFRYIEWHNQAFALSQDAQLETLVVHYEDYTVDIDAVSTKLLRFLGLTPQGSKNEFIPGKIYRHYFDDDERRAVHEAFKIMASRQTWPQVQKYFGRNFMETLDKE